MDNIDETGWESLWKRVKKTIVIETVESKVEFQDRMLTIFFQVDPTDRNENYNKLIEELWNRNMKEEEKIDKRRKYSKQQEQFLRDNPSLKVGQLITMNLFKGKTKASLYSKKSRLFRSALR